MRATRSPWRGARFAVFPKNVPAVASTRPKPADVMPLGRRVCNCLKFVRAVPVGSYQYERLNTLYSSIRTLSLPDPEGPADVCGNGRSVLHLDPSIPDLVRDY